MRQWPLRSRRPCALIASIAKPLETTVQEQVATRKDSIASEPKYKMKIEKDVDVLLDLHLIFGFGRYAVFAGRDLLLHGRLQWLGNRRYQSARSAATQRPLSHTSR